MGGLEIRRWVLHPRKHLEKDRLPLRRLVVWGMSLQRSLRIVKCDVADVRTVV